ncbi:MAG: nucleotide exchange factor GrpE [Clostridia bacterium]|mgnify:CR=1 FL=1|jgi:molecular chaperone GrpE|nr:nucleotide exchange factor GrpE [Clostridia bacterium]HPD90808.1 nucleotide exchange factor GrpE [Bacillota bacterium]
MSDSKKPDVNPIGEEIKPKKRKEETLEKEKHKQDSEHKKAHEKETAHKKEMEAEIPPEEPSGKEESQEEELKTQYLRLAADFANYKKRSEKERSDIHAFANEKLVAKLLEVLDNFDRALAQEETEKNPVWEGMALIYKQLLGILEGSGLEEIQALGQPFDPEFHEALMMDSSTDQESGTVTEVFQKGYMLHKKVIRPTRVKVAQ